MKRFILPIIFFAFILPSLANPVFADTISPSTEIKLSTPISRNVLSGRIMPPELKQASWKKYNYEAGFGLFGERHKAYPAVFILAGKGGNAIGLSYFNSTTPFIKDKYDFLRSNDIAVKRTVSSVLVNGVSTVTYITDEISRFHSRTQIFDFFYIRTFIGGKEKYKLDFIMGIPIAYNSYSLRCSLDNGSVYSESDSSFGAGLSAGFKFSAANSLLLNKGLIFSMGAIYRKLWFKNVVGKIDGPLRSEISGFRVFINTGWRFNFYN
ncbi:MAG: hypothetical protein KAR84_05135 [Elusimicrobiales bacterium]|nr:hypothetical protein [Elusimicrobiales bacterium]